MDRTHTRQKIRAGSKIRVQRRKGNYWIGEKVVGREGEVERSERLCSWMMECLTVGPESWASPKNK
eukprot:4267134-Pleurochrysis_carterae.AAC.1